MKNTLEEAKKVYQEISASTKADDKLFSYILNKCIIQTETAFFREKLSLQELCAATRYNLEALINIKLCDQNEAETVAMVFNHNKTYVTLLQNQRDQYEREMKILEEYQQKEQSISKKIDLKNIAESVKAQKENSEKLDQEFLSEPVYLTDSKSVFSNGYGFSAYYIKDKILPKLENEIKQYEKKIVDESKKIKNDVSCQFSFSFNNKTQPSKVAKLMELEYISWSDKAQKTELEDEYSFIYAYTSNLIHCVSTSFYTTPDVEKTDKQILEKASSRYLNQIIQFVKQRQDPEDIKVFITKKSKS